MDLSGGMSFSRVQGNFGDLHNLNNQQRNLFIEVIILDLTHPARTAYQLKQNTTFTDEELKQIKQGIISIPQDAFMLLGEVESINKKSKQVILTDQNTVTYNHLITVTGKQPTLLSYEFLAGLHTLVDALRLNRTLPGKMSTATSQKLAFELNVTLQENNDEKIEKLGNSKMLSQTPEQATVLVSELNKKLFQIQI